MSVDLHSTQVLNKVIDNLPDRTTFLVDMFFPEVNVSDEETIMFDTTSGRKLVAAFVSPLTAARLTADIGYETDSFRPAYVKDLRAFDPKKGSKRMPGEKIGGTMSPLERIKKAIKANLNEQIDMVAGRLEVMAGEILTTGKVTISGEKYPTRILDFKRRVENNVVKTGAARWGEAGISPYNELDAECQELSDATGFGPTDIIFGVEAWKLYYADMITNHKDKLDKTIENGSMAEVLMGYIRQPRDGVAYRGRNGYLRFWTYTGTYTDPETGVTGKTLGDYDVLIGGASIDGVRHFGAIQDFEAGLQARQYFSNAWPERNPSRLLYQLQSAPLLVPYRRNNVKRLKVR